MPAFTLRTAVKLLFVALAPTAPGAATNPAAPAPLVVAHEPRGIAPPAPPSLRGQRPSSASASTIPAGSAARQTEEDDGVNIHACFTLFGKNQNAPCSDMEYCTLPEACCGTLQCVTVNVSLYCLDILEVKGYYWQYQSQEEECRYKWGCCQPKQE
jgi:hypothetical protein